MSATRSGPREEVKAPASSLTTNEYVKIHGYKAGPMVKVLIGADKQLYTIPRDLLCKHSQFFRAAFESNFVEGIEQVCHIESAEIEPFEMILQWIGTGCIILPGNRLSADEIAENTQRATVHGLKLRSEYHAKEDDSESSDEELEKDNDSEPSTEGRAEENDSLPSIEEHAEEYQHVASDDEGSESGTLSTSASWDTMKFTAEGWKSSRCCKQSRSPYFQFCRFLDFLFLADCLMVSPCPINFVEEMIRELCSPWCCKCYSRIKPINLLDSSMIQRAWQLSRAHPIRKLLIEACTENYIKSRIHLDKGSQFKFRFEAELDSVPGFASDLMQQVVQTLMSADVQNDPNECIYTVVNPILGDESTWGKRFPGPIRWA